MYYEKLVDIRERLLYLFDKRGVFLDEEEWELQIVFEEKEFQELILDLQKEFNIDVKQLRKFITPNKLSLQICEKIIWNMENM